MTNLAGESELASIHAFIFKDLQILVLHTNLRTPQIGYNNAEERLEYTMSIASKPNAFAVITIWDRV